VVKPTGNVVVWKWDFLQNTFGNSVPDQDPDGDAVQFVMGLRFPGQYADGETGLNYNYYRTYEPTTARYAEVDPTLLGGGLAVYSYVRNEPLSLLDPRGLAGIPGLQCFPWPSCTHGCEEVYINCKWKIKLFEGAVGAVAGGVGAGVATFYSCGALATAGWAAGTGLAGVLVTSAFTPRWELECDNEFATCKDGCGPMTCLKPK
jgi:RHS repeat-associated protein